MKPMTMPILALAALSLLAGPTLHAQTNTNSPVAWRDTSAPKTARIAAAQAELADAALPQRTRRVAAGFLVREGALDASATIADPAAGGNITDPAEQAELAVVAKVTKAQKLAAASDYAGALALLTSPDVLGNNPYAYILAADLKRKSKAPDALEWAKASYAVRPFSQTREGINAVNAALLAQGGNINEANRFIAYQTSGEGDNPLAGVAYPDAAKKVTDYTSPVLAIYGKVFKGQNAAAVQDAVARFEQFNNPGAINANVDLVASILRDIDGNVVRANAYVEAQKNGETFDIAELR